MTKDNPNTIHNNNTHVDDNKPIQVEKGLSQINKVPSCSKITPSGNPCNNKCLDINKYSDVKSKLYTNYCRYHGGLRELKAYYNENGIEIGIDPRIKASNTHTTNDDSIGNPEVGGGVADNEVPYSCVGGAPSEKGGYLSKSYILAHLRQIDEICKSAYHKAKGKKANNKDIETYLKIQDKAAKFRDMMQEIEKNSTEVLRKKHAAEIQAWTNAVSELVDDNLWSQIVKSYRKRVGKE